MFSGPRDQKNKSFDRSNYSSPNSGASANYNKQKTKSVMKDDVGEYIDFEEVEEKK